MMNMPKEQSKLTRFFLVSEFMIVALYLGSGTRKDQQITSLSTSSSSGSSAAWFDKLLEKQELDLDFVSEHIRGTWTRQSLSSEERVKTVTFEVYNDELKFEESKVVFKGIAPNVAKLQAGRYLIDLYGDDKFLLFEDANAGAIRRPKIEHGLYSKVSSVDELSGGNLEDGDGSKANWLNALKKANKYDFSSIFDGGGGGIWTRQSTFSEGPRTLTLHTAKGKQGCILEVDDKNKFTEEVHFMDSEPNLVVAHFTSGIYDIDMYTKSDLVLKKNAQPPGDYNYGLYSKVQEDKV